MILSNGAFLKSTRLNAIVRDQSENYQRRLPLRFLDRTAIVDADDEEITGSYTGKVLAADVIADDQAALVYDTGAFEFVTNVIPNLKIGQRITQSKLNMLERMERGNIDRDEVGVFEGWQATVAANLRRGVEERMNALICAMMLDNVTYDRFGVKLAVNWGTPSGYKVTPSNLWTVAASATPITDILALKEFAEIDSGQNFDRVTMAKATFRLMTATTEFKNLIIGLVGQPITAATAYNTYDQRLEGFASQLLGMDIEFEDKVYHEQSAAGVVSATRVMPANKVLLSSKSSDNNPAIFDFGNAVVTESIVSSILGGVGTLGGRQSGPVAYWTGDENLNAPNLVGWAVTRGFPRKHIKQAFGVLTVAA